MSYIYHGKKGWIKQPNRNFKTFESGLCLIQEEYICSSDQIDYSAFQIGNPIENSEPCIDGAFIYPDPVYQNLGNGFTKCIVSAYGRTNSIGSEINVNTKAIIPVFVYYLNSFINQNQVGYSTDYTQIGTIETYVVCPTIKIVLPKNQYPALSLSKSDVQVFDQNGNDISNKRYFPTDFLVRNLTTGIYEPVISQSVYDGDFTGRKLQYKLTPSNISAVSYGKFTEYTIILNDLFIISDSPFGDSLDFGNFYTKIAPGSVPIIISTEYLSAPPGIINNITSIDIEGPIYTAMPTINVEYMLITIKTSSGTIINGFSNYKQIGSNFSTRLTDLSNGTYTVSCILVNKYGTTRISEGFNIFNP